jgi:hypothetical protein
VISGAFIKKLLHNHSVIYKIIIFFLKKGKIALTFASPEKENYYFIYYAVIVKQNFYKRSTNHYFCVAI